MDKAIAQLAQLENEGEGDSDGDDFIDGLYKEIQSENKEVKSKLKKHYQIKHDRYCPNCYVYFSKYDDLDQHVLQHAVADSNKFTCEKCSMTFTTKKKYQKHLNNKHAPTLSGVGEVGQTTPLGKHAPQHMI